MALDYAHAYQTFIDEELAAASATEWMAAKGGQVRFNGGKEVEIATLTTTGLGNYDSTQTDGGAYRLLLKVSGGDFIAGIILALSIAC